MARKGVINFNASQAFIGNTRDQNVKVNDNTVGYIDVADSVTAGARVFLMPKSVAGNNDAQALFSLAFNYANDKGIVFNADNGTTGTRINAFIGATQYSSAHGVAVYGRWATYVYRLSGTTLDFFIDGVKVHTATVVRKTYNSGSQFYIATESIGTVACRRIVGNINDAFLVKSALTDAQIRNISLYGIYPAVDVRYRIDEGTGSTVTDISGNGRNGTITGSTWTTTDTFGKTRTASSNRVSVQDMKASLSFNGGTTKIDLGTPTILTSLADYSFECLLKPSSATAGVLLSAGFDYATNNGFLIKREANGQIIVFNGNNSIGSLGLTAPRNWLHLVVTQSGSSVSFYLNGSLNYSGTKAQKAQSGSNWFVGAEKGTSVFLPATVSRIKIYNTALSATDIASRYRGLPISTAPVASYNLDEGAGTTAYDSSGNGNHGTITSGTYVSDTPTKKRKTINDNLVYNGDFEYAPPFTAATGTSARWIDGSAGGSATNSVFGWGIVKSGTITAQFDTSQGVSGNGLKLSTTVASSWVEAYIFPGENAANVSTFGIRVLPSTSYTLSYYMKTNYTSGDSSDGAFLVVREYNGAGTAVATANGTRVKVTQDWTRYEMSFTTGANTRYLTPRLSLYGHTGTGTLIMDAWFDDIQLRPTTPTTRGVVS